LGVEVQGQEVPAVEVIGLVYSGSALSGGVNLDRHFSQ
jgi:hypothetical protein